MWLKIIALIGALFLLFAGGLCSIFLVSDPQSITKLFGVVLAVVCFGLVIDVILWMFKKEYPSSWIKLFIVFLIVLAAYILSWSGLLDIRVAG
jgi:uncharacterized membrane protein YdcZ (DUF606 family)